MNATAVSLINQVNNAHTHGWSPKHALLRAMARRGRAGFAAESATYGLSGLSLVGIVLLPFLIVGACRRNVAVRRERRA